ncbi:hypothetical protein [Lentzea guizhouensis]|uniref:hypothetical protein n=1 Tax=Lentzea guizhouensis TaxID=1586287 RepID=UPI0012B698A6|nr:hypothetical protein [Lentzea guizhouensis]
MRPLATLTINRELVGQSWPELADLVRERGRRVRHVRVELTSGTDRVLIDIGDRISVLGRRAAYRVQVEADGAEERVVPAAEEAIGHLARPNRRGERWGYAKLIIMAVLAPLPLIVVEVVFEPRIEAPGADRARLIGEMAGAMVASSFFWMFPLLLLATGLSTLSTAAVLLDRATVTMPKSRYERMVEWLHQGRFARPFLADPARSGVVIALVGVVVGVVIGVLGMVIGILI